MFAKKSINKWIETVNETFISLKCYFSLLSQIEYLVFVAYYPKIIVQVTNGLATNAINCTISVRKRLYNFPLYIKQGNSGNSIDNTFMQIFTIDIKTLKNYEFSKLKSACF